MPDSSIFDNRIDLTDKGFYEFFTQSTRLATKIYVDVVKKDYFEQKEKERLERRKDMFWCGRAAEDISLFTKRNSI